MITATMAIEQMGLRDPIGQIVDFDGKRQIIGVVKNFHFQSLHEKVKPFFFKIHYTWQGGNFIVKLNALNQQATLRQVGKLYAQYNTGYLFDYRFMDADYQSLYLSEQQVAHVSQYVATVAILISCLGLFGLSAFSAERRKKEMSIRKVVGASKPQLVYLLTWEFARLVLLAIIIAIPASYLLSEKWLSRFAYRIKLEPTYFLLAASLALLVALLTVGGHALKAALVNPVHHLKEE